MCVVCGVSFATFLRINKSLRRCRWHLHCASLAYHLAGGFLGVFGGTMKKLFVCLTLSILLVTAYSEAQLSNAGALSWLEDQPIVAKVERSGWVAGSVDIHVNNAWDAMKKYEKELLVNSWAQTWKAVGGKTMFVYDTEGKQVASLSLLQGIIVR